MTPDKHAATFLLLQAQQDRDRMAAHYLALLQETVAIATNRVIWAKAATVEAALELDQAEADLLSRQAELRKFTRETP